MKNVYTISRWCLYADNPNTTAMIQQLTRLIIRIFHVPGHCVFFKLGPSPHWVVTKAPPRGQVVPVDEHGQPLMAQAAGSPNASLMAGTLATPPPLGIHRGPEASPT